MMLIRPVREEDHAAVLELAKEAGTGMTSLPQDEDVLWQKIHNSINSFSGKLTFKGTEKFLFVMEDTSNGRLAGTCGLVAHVGLRRPFYSYKISTITQASSVVVVYSMQKVLHMVNDYTGASEIGSLFLTKDYRRDGLGKFLSRSRYLMMAEFPDVFSDIVISEIRGVQDKNGESPFYNNLAKHFFKMEFKDADYISAVKGNQFIADLMPKYPIYIALLPKDAQDTIGTPLEASRPALEMLQAEGFRYEGYIDVFDAGPTVQAERASIRSVRKSHKLKVQQIKPQVEGKLHIISNTVFADFRLCLGKVAIEGDEIVAIEEESAKKLNIKAGDDIRIVNA